MKHINVIAITIIACLPMASQARDVQTYVGVNYEWGHLNVGGHHANVGGFKFLSASELGWGNIKGTASTLTGGGADYDDYSLGVEKPFSIQQSNVFVSPEAAVTYAQYKDDQLKVSDLGALIGVSLGYNINNHFQIVSNYNHSFGMKSNQINIDEDSLSAGLNYRFN